MTSVRISRHGAIRRPEAPSGLLEQQGRRVEAVFPTDTGDGLVDDFVAVITSMAARIYGRRNSKRRAAQIQACVKRCVEQVEA